jgi:predicted RNase H-like HicB family nuclease
MRFEREADGRWIAVVDALPGVMAYGVTYADARARATGVALQVIAEQIDDAKVIPDPVMLASALVLALRLFAAAITSALPVR